MILHVAALAFLHRCYSATHGIHPPPIMTALAGTFYAGCGHSCNTRVARVGGVVPCNDTMISKMMKLWVF